ncbi:MAG: hypothetical protein M3P41_13060 [Actinomycetota bacterium]|nr:hypothetical protein [Actinomycetota bacterium]
MAEDASTELPPHLRTMLEQVGEALGLGVGEAELRVRFSDGRVRWWEPSRVRVPPSKLEEPPRLRG